MRGGGCSSTSPTSAPSPSRTTPTFGGHTADSDSYKNVTLPNTEFDELVIGSWIHLEQMDNGTWWMNVGGLTLWVKADRDGKPLSVSVHGPGDYAGQEPGCEYHLAWSGDDVIKPHSSKGN